MTDGYTRVDVPDFDTPPTLDEIYDNLEDIMTTEAAVDWVHRPNRKLGDRTPYQAYLEHDRELVMRIIDDLAGGPRR